MKTILSLYDYTGNWSLPYKEAGYNVVQIDLMRGRDVRRIQYDQIGNIHGILAAPPCTAFSSSGAQYWLKKDFSGETYKGLALVDAVIRIVYLANPVWWVLENPVGRLKRYIGPYTMTFQPYEFGDPYKKKTCLWGNFNTNLIRNRVEVEKNNKWLMKLGGKSLRTKIRRSATPMGFSRAFFQANP